MPIVPGRPSATGVADTDDADAGYNLLVSSITGNDDYTGNGDFPDDDEYTGYRDDLGNGDYAGYRDDLDDGDYTGYGDDLRDGDYTGYGDRAGDDIAVAHGVLLVPVIVE